MTTLHDEISKGYERGWSFTPLDGKIPIVKEWQSLDSMTPVMLAMWSTRTNFGLRTGEASGIAVIDIEAESFAQPSDFPETVTVITGGGGFHLYYTCDLPVSNSVSKLAPMVDVRGDRGQVVFVGSTHPDTARIYQWFWGMSPDDIPIAAFPYHLLPKPRQYNQPSRVNVDAREVGNAEQRCVQYLIKCRDAISGQGGSSVTYAAACCCWRFGLDRAVVGRVMAWYNETKTGGEMWTDCELQYKIDRAFEAVMQAGDIGLMLRRA